MICQFFYAEGVLVRLGRSFACKLPAIAVLALTSLVCGQIPQKINRAEAVRLNNIGVALMNQQEMEKAVTKFDEALRADASLTTAELNKGIALLNLQKLPEAEAALKRAASAEPGNPRVWFNLALLHRNQAMNEAAAEDVQRVLKIDPNDADSHYLLGTLLQQMQQNSRAVAEYEAALKLNPLHASAEFGLARILQRIGKTEDARVHLKRFEHLTRDKISSAITLGYGEQGRYSTAEQIVTNEPIVGAMIPITFLASEIGSPSPAQSGLDGGICVIDLNGDSRPDLIVTGGKQTLQVLINEGKGEFKRTPAEAFGLIVKGHAVSCAVGDYDNDKLPDLVVGLDNGLVLFRNEGQGKFSDATKTAGLTPRNKPAGITFVDFDHDGDLDLFVTGTKLANSTSGPNILWRNNGNGTFTDWTEESGLGGDGETVGAVLSDINNDRAVDLIVTGSGSAPTVYANPREGKFPASPVYSAALSSTAGVVVFDFNKDGWMDIAVTHTGAPGITLWKNVDGRKFERVTLPLEVKRGWGITAVDIDNDGWVDLVAVVETAKGTEVHVLRNLGERGFADVTNDVGLSDVRFRDARSVVASDIDADGDSDLIVSQASGSTLVLRNDGGNRNHSLRLSFAGLADNRSGLGTKIEVFSDGLWQKWEISGGSGYLSQGSSEILAGLGSHTNADIVRMLWPTGVIQDELDIAADKPVSFSEIDRRGSSCPTLFAWNGEKYGFISDVIGAAVIGHWVSPTEKNIADTDEWVKIEGSQLRAKNGKLSFRFGEPMEEVNFLDQVRLVAIDHPAGTEVYPNERFLSAPPFPETRTIISTSAHVPAGAWDDKRDNVLDLLRERDHRYVKDFTNMKFAGYANMHSLTLDLGEWNPSSPIRMFMLGFIEYFTATSMYAAWQAGINPVAPYVEAQMPDGTWKRVVDDMGFPAGLPRTIVVDLTGKLPPGTRNIRIMTNLQIYWDQILIDNGPGKAPIRTTVLPLASASLAFRGYPQQIEGDTPGDLTYNYSEVSLTGPFSRERGPYTRYGDVTDLLTRVDDHYVIFGSGEDMDLEFRATTLPPLPAGWKRDYFFYANGFVKDMDFYEASPFTVAQLPFHGMKKYPYSEGQQYPDDPATLKYFVEWNDRFESGKGGAGYRFQYQPRTDKTH